MDVSQKLLRKAATDAPPNTKGERVWLVLMKAHRALARHAQRSLEAANMGLSDFATLEVLLHKGPQPVNEIGRRVGLTSGSITTAVDRMEERKLVERCADPQDRRARIVRLSPAGKKLIQPVFSQHAAAMEDACNALTKTERETLIQLLKKLGLSAEQRFETRTDP